MCHLPVPSSATHLCPAVPPTCAHQCSAASQCHHQCHLSVLSISTHHQWHLSVPPISAAYP
ncbi:unnamed protein product [Staurois parvus]|uniref:Uncharacterized protein n=1 Tax=Staurois parvus TaxID=386267 RepID=A0ABN9CVM3_9NEOB|nr:unnamed protein product [Staurois parvus]